MHYPVYFGEELRDAGREIPRSIFRGLYLIVVSYPLCRGVGEIGGETHSSGVVP